MLFPSFYRSLSLRLEYLYTHKPGQLANDPIDHWSLTSWVKKGQSNWNLSSLRRAELWHSLSPDFRSPPFASLRSSVPLMVSSLQWNHCFTHSQLRFSLSAVTSVLINVWRNFFLKDTKLPLLALGAPVNYTSGSVWPGWQKVMSKAPQTFVTPLTLKTLRCHRIYE